MKPSIPAVALPRLVDRLAELALRHREQPELELPVVQLGTVGGQTLTGQVLGQEAGPRGHVLALLETDERGRPTGAFTYADIGGLTLVRVLDIDRHAWLLAFHGQAPPPPAPEEPAPGALALRRRLAQLQEQLGVAGVELTVGAEPASEGEHRRALLVLAEQAAACLAELAADADGREALAPIRSLTLRHGEARVHRDGDALELWAELDRGPLGRLTAAELSDALAAVL